MKKILALSVVLALATPCLFASDETLLKAAYVLNNKGTEPFFSWLLIQESNYYIKNLISFGYEVQFSYFKTAGAVPGADISTFPLNVFFNSKLKILRKGFIRPFIGAGVGVLSSVSTHPEHYSWEKSLATHLLAGVSLGVGEQAALHLEFRVLNSDKPDFKTKFLVAGGISY